MLEQPSLFISHGAPTLAITPSPARKYLQFLGRSLNRADAIVVVSAHHDERGVMVTADRHPETLHDFGPFADELFKIRYPAPGHPALARDITVLLSGLGFVSKLQTNRGFDHGAWVPLHLINPAADVPVVQVSIDTSVGPRRHFELGQALSRLRQQNILIIGSGSFSHNLSAFLHGGFAVDAQPEKWVAEFTRWLADKLLAQDVDAALDAVAKGPWGPRNHPTMDHILPLFVAMGAGAPSTETEHLHSSTTFGVLAMDAFGFGPRALIGALKDESIEQR